MIMKGVNPPCVSCAEYTPYDGNKSRSEQCQCSHGEHDVNDNALASSRACCADLDGPSTPPSPPSARRAIPSPFHPHTRPKRSRRFSAPCIPAQRPQRPHPYHGSSGRGHLRHSPSARNTWPQFPTPSVHNEFRNLLSRYAPQYAHSHQHDHDFLSVRWVSQWDDILVPSPAHLLDLGLPVPEVVASNYMPASSADPGGHARFSSHWASNSDGEEDKEQLAVDVATSVHSLRPGGNISKCFGRESFKRLPVFSRLAELANLPDQTGNEPVPLTDVFLDSSQQDVRDVAPDTTTFGSVELTPAVSSSPESMASSCPSLEVRCYSFPDCAEASNGITAGDSTKTLATNCDDSLVRTEHESSNIPDSDRVNTEKSGSDVVRLFVDSRDDTNDNSSDVRDANEENDDNDYQLTIMARRRNECRPEDPQCPLKSEDDDHFYTKSELTAIQISPNHNSLFREEQDMDTDETLYTDYQDSVDSGCEYGSEDSSSETSDVQSIITPGNLSSKDLNPRTCFPIHLSSPCSVTYSLPSLVMSTSDSSSCSNLVHTDSTPSSNIPITRTDSDLQRNCQSSSSDVEIELTTHNKRSVDSDPKLLQDYEMIAGTDVLKPEILETLCAGSQASRTLQSTVTMTSQTSQYIEHTLCSPVHADHRAGEMLQSKENDRISDDHDFLGDSFNIERLSSVGNRQTKYISDAFQNDNADETNKDIDDIRNDRIKGRNTDREPAGRPRHEVKQARDNEDTTLVNSDTVSTSFQLTTGRPMLVGKRRKLRSSLSLGNKIRESLESGTSTETVSKSPENYSNSVDVTGCTEDSNEPSHVSNKTALCETNLDLDETERRSLKRPLICTIDMESIIRILKECDLLD